MPWNLRLLFGIAQTVTTSTTCTASSAGQTVPWWIQKVVVTEMDGDALHVRMQQQSFPIHTCVSVVCFCYLHSISIVRHFTNSLTTCVLSVAILRLIGQSSTMDIMHQIYKEFQLFVFIFNIILLGMFIIEISNIWNSFVLKLFWQMANVNMHWLIWGWSQNDVFMTWIKACLR